MVASENYQMETEIPIEENISVRERLTEVLATINYKTGEEIKCALESEDNDSFPIGGVANSKEEDMSKVDSETVAEILYQDAVNLAGTKLSQKQPNRHSKSGSVPPQVQSKVRRVPSTANPKHRTPLLYKSQRSNSSPHIHPHLKHNQRRQSLPQNLQNVASIHNKANANGVNSSLYQELIKHQLHVQQNAKQPVPSNKSGHDPQATATQYGSAKGGQQQQQIIYIQIPNVPHSQNYDSQVLQQQISSQLQQLVPQIYTQLVSQTTVPQSTDFQNSRSKSPSTLSLNSNSSGETILPPAKAYQQHQGSGAPDNTQPHRSRRKSLESGTLTSQSFEVINETANQHGTAAGKHSASTFAQENAALLQQQFAAAIDLQQQQKSPVVPQITIPLSQELLLQCQQLRDQAYAAYQPRLETIHEEAMSVKKLAVSKLSKSKIFACILTVLSLIVVVVLAGDRTIAVVVITVMFLIFFLGLVGFLYLNSAKNATNGFAP